MLRIGGDAPEVVTNYSFPLDPFQRIAIKAIQDEENVLVTAKTGSGKTLIAEYQIEYSLNKGKRVFYTSPIKSLTNQKYHDLKKVYGSRVGIMTGDIKFAPHADVVVMTTEILTNLLYKLGTSTENIGTTSMLSMNDVDAVIFDEVHYINNPERGRVWEECLILLPPEIKLVLLSATIDSPELFADWIGELKKRPIHLISTTYRVVPLKHCVLQGTEFKVILDEKDRFHKDVYNKYLAHLKNAEDESYKHKKNVESRKADGYDAPVVIRETREKSFVARMNDALSILHTKGLLPVMFFVFSRRQCEELALKVEHNLLSPSDSESVRHIVKFHLSRYHLHTISQYQQLLQLLEKGIAFHHSGVLPILKEIIEILFSKGLIRVLFATETFAVGINMPTKTVVFTNFRKHDTEGLRLLRTDEYIQMAGRAGRRGKDTEGLVIYLHDRKPETLEDVQHMMTGRTQVITSRLDFHYNLLIKSLHLGRDWISIYEKSYFYQQRLNEISLIQDELVKISMPNIPFAELEERERIENKIRNSNNAEQREARKQLEQWKNKRISPIWDQHWKQFKQFKADESRKLALQAQISELSKPAIPFLGYLEEMGFVKDGKLTDIGVIASEINEGHPLIMAKMYDETRKLNRNELIAYFGCFVEPENDDVYPCEHIKELVNKTYETADFLRSIEKVESPPNYWNVYEYWCQIMCEWMTGTEFEVICSTYGIYEGNFMKAVLKVANIADEYINIATLKQDIEMLEVLRDVRQTLIRGIVIPDSLYLRL